MSGQNHVALVIHSSLSASSFSFLPLALFSAALAFLFSMTASSSTSFSSLTSDAGASFGLGPSSQVLSYGASSSLGSYSLPQATGLIMLCTV